MSKYCHAVVATTHLPQERPPLDMEVNDGGLVEGGDDDGVTVGVAAGAEGEERAASQQAFGIGDGGL
jgi:hypothetical protein